MNDAVTYEAFREVLNSLRPGWVTMGDAIVGPDGATVRLTQRHESLSEGHVDVQFVLDDNAPRKVELWDCVVGYGTTPADRARFAAYLWGQTTAGTLLELKYSRRGEFADHYHATDEVRFPDGTLSLAQSSALVGARAQVHFSGGGLIIRYFQSWRVLWMIH